MKKLTAVDTLNLSIPERIQLVEEIWDTIASQAREMDLSEEEKKLIDKRLEAYHRDPESGAPWEEVYQRIIGKHEV